MRRCWRKGWNLSGTMARVSSLVEWLALFHHDRSCILDLASPAGRFMPDISITQQKKQLDQTHDRQAHTTGPLEDVGETQKDKRRSSLHARFALVLHWSKAQIRKLAKKSWPRDGIIGPLFASII
ncbi:hypothetical protein B0T17DRAFT_513010 [Bombardia bombarda]|uniref:Uncharacterized protein n=1 Tax=Bombardia bombarda TaxID=252184 RepID=A0AA40CD20_9PEZI|nr:hypothetical protein B0T17DRAFT_513010 [Bombardia bombarda]